MGFNPYRKIEYYKEFPVNWHSKKRTVAVFDLSWQMYRNFYANQELSSVRVPRQNEDDNIPSQELPIAHVYLTLRDISNLADSFDLVVLALDKYPSERHELYPEYKKGREKEKTGDIYKDYRPFDDFHNLLRMACTKPNVFLSQHEDWESDDIIGSFIQSTKDYPEIELTCFFNDADIAQNPGVYNWNKVLDGSYQPIEEFIKSFLDLDMSQPSPYKVLPLWWKVVRGCPSDNVYPSLIRFPGKVLYPLCKDLENTWDFEEFKNWLITSCKSGDLKDTVWEDRLIGAESKEWFDKAYTNYRVVKPYVKDISELPLYKPAILENNEIVWDKDVSRLYGFYQINEEKLQLAFQPGTVTLPRGPETPEESDPIPFIPNISSNDINEYARQQGFDI